MLLRVYVFLTVFFAGASLMSLEMAGFRLVQPEFGSDIIVWGSLISVILLGLALGAYIGGKVADWKPSLWILGGIMIGAGIWSALMPLYSDGVFALFTVGNEMVLPMELNPMSSGGTIMAYEPPDLRWPTLAVGLVLFFFPSLLLGSISPYSARLLIRKMPNIGRGVGKISAISTLGSIVGTIGSTFYLMQLLGTRGLIVASGVVMILTGIGCWMFPLLRYREPDAVAAVETT